MVLIYLTICCFLSENGPNSDFVRKGHTIPLNRGSCSIRSHFLGNLDTCLFLSLPEPDSSNVIVWPRTLKPGIIGFVSWQGTLIFPTSCSSNRDQMREVPLVPLKYVTWPWTLVWPEVNLVNQCILDPDNYNGLRVKFRRSDYKVIRNQARNFSDDQLIFVSNSLRQPCNIITYILFSVKYFSRIYTSWHKYAISKQIRGHDGSHSLDQ